jgi:hypothetical protein
MGHAIVNMKAARTWPCIAHTAPASPSMIAAEAAWARPLKASATRDAARISAASAGAPRR